ncbi:MAG: flavin reductase family protein [Bacteroidetes bacterium]|nr:flavin reductase family protein [Bacteroidota bacterium]
MNSFKTIVPENVPVPELHGYLLGAINPRPIAFVATLDAENRPNLAPFSFYNVFGANPPIVVFSPARRGRDNSTKNTFENLKVRGECTINTVSYSMIHQAVLASTEYPAGVNEFAKAGFGTLKSEVVKVPRVAESPAQMECKVRDVINYGKLPGGGNLVIAEVVRVHVSTRVLDDAGKIDPYKIDTVGRCGGEWYNRVRDGLFEIATPKGQSNVGFDQMPKRIRDSKVLTGNDLGKLGLAAELPKKESIAEFVKQSPELRNLLNEGEIEQRLHILAKKHLEKGDVESAWKVLMANKV